MSRAKRVALFGGSFDPVHRGHLFIAEKAVEACGLDQVIFVPCRISPHKVGRQISASADRVEMLRLATADIDWAEVSDWEILREEASYSWKTAEHFSRELGAGVELFWIVGTDQWEVIETWAKPEVLAELVTFVVFPRGGIARPKDGFRMVAVDASFDASSTDIRRRVRDGEAISDLVLPEVECFVSDRGLYR
ncbi:MAG: nicotinate (nicotinamide) nucleotide adenylyltransferase [Verrucomicrobiales bacterium]